VVGCILASLGLTNSVSLKEELGQFAIVWEYCQAFRSAVRMPSQYLGPQPPDFSLSVIIVVIRSFVLLRKTHLAAYTGVTLLMEEGWALV